MTDFNPGAKAPDFKLSSFSLSAELKKGPLLLTFYKKTCPTCQLGYPYLEKIHKHYSGDNFQVVGIGQDPETKEFSDEYGITFKMVSDTADYKVSQKYHLTNVPSIFLITPDQKIQNLCVGFHKGDFIEICKKISEFTKKPMIKVFDDKGVPDFKAG